MVFDKPLIVAMTNTEAVLPFLMRGAFRRPGLSTSTKSLQAVEEVNHCHCPPAQLLSLFWPVGSRIGRRIVAGPHAARSSAAQHPVGLPPRLVRHSRRRKGVG